MLETLPEKAMEIDYERRYIRTRSGGRFFALEPEHGEIEIDDIAHGLANSCRWGGQCKYWYPVAAHSIWCSLIVPEPFKLCALLHDSSEGLGLADIASPFKAFLPDYKKIEDTAMTGIARKFGFEWPMPPEVKKADMLALYHERKVMFDAPIRLDKATIPMLGLPKGWKLPVWRYDDWTPERAKAAFLFAFEAYTS
jgi:uncharacterized protein